MKSLYEINKELDKFINLKNNMLFDFPSLNHVTLAMEDITKSITMIYEIREIIENNTLKDAYDILSKKRKDIIKEIKNLSQIPCNKRDYMVLDILTDNLKCLNWVLDKDEFDTEII